MVFCNSFLKKFSIIFLLCIILFTFFNISFAAVDPVQDLEDILVRNRDNSESKFVNFCYYHYINNTNLWQNYLKEILDEINQYNYLTFILPITTTSNNAYYIGLYTYTDTRTLSNVSYTSPLDGQTYQIRHMIFSKNYRSLNYNPSTGETSYAVNSGNHISMAAVCYGYRSLVFTNLLQDVQSSNINYSNYLNSIQNYLSNLDGNVEDILPELQNISSILSNINIPNYSNQISNIGGQISQVLTDNQTIISQNSDMLQQQEEINTNLETLNDNLMDDNFDNTNLNLPTNNTQNSADSGINNIFNSMYNAFCSGIAQDIILPIPFTNKNITIEPDFLYNALYNSNANWLILFIQAFWGYLIGRFIVLDVNDKFNKIKSGNIENIENSNIKGDLL